MTRPHGFGIGESPAFSGYLLLKSFSSPMRARYLGSKHGDQQGRENHDVHGGGRGRSGRRCANAKALGALRGETRRPQREKGMNFAPAGAMEALCRLTRVRAAEKT